MYVHYSCSKSAVEKFDFGGKRSSYHFHFTVINDQDISIPNIAAYEIPLSVSLK